MPDPIDMPLMNALPDPSERVYESNASRATHDNEAFMAELQRKRHREHEEEDEQKSERDDDTYERSYKENKSESRVVVQKKSGEEKLETGSPGQVIDIKA